MHKRRCQQIYTQVSLCIPDCSGTCYADQSTGIKGTIHIWLKDLSESGTNSCQSNCSWTTLHKNNQLSLERPRLKPAPTCSGSGLHTVRGAVPSPPSVPFETARGSRTCEAATERQEESWIYHNEERALRLSADPSSLWGSTLAAGLGRCILGQYKRCFWWRIWDFLIRIQRMAGENTAVV